MVVSAILGSPGRTGCFPGRLVIQDFPFARKKEKGSGGLEPTRRLRLLSPVDRPKLAMERQPYLSVRVLQSPWVGCPNRRVAASTGVRLIRDATG